MKRPRKNPFPKKIGPKSTVFQGDPPVRPRGEATAAMSHKVGGGGGLTTNRSKPSGGAGSGGPTTSVD